MLSKVFLFTVTAQTCICRHKIWWLKDIFHLCNSIIVGHTDGGQGQDQSPETGKENGLGLKREDAPVPEIADQDQGIVNDHVQEREEDQRTGRDLDQEREKGQGQERDEEKMIKGAQDPGKEG